MDEVLEVRVNPSARIKRNLCLDAEFVGKSDIVGEPGFVPRIRSRGKEK